MLPKKEFDYRSHEDAKNYNSNVSFKKKTSTTDHYQEMAEDSFKGSDDSSDDKIMDVDTNQMETNQVIESLQTDGGIEMNPDNYLQNLE